MSVLSIKVPIQKKSVILSNDLFIYIYAYIYILIHTHTCVCVCVYRYICLGYLFFLRSIYRNNNPSYLISFHVFSSLNKDQKKLNHLEILKAGLKSTGPNLASRWSGEALHQCVIYSQLSSTPQHITIYTFSIVPQHLLGLTRVYIVPWQCYSISSHDITAKSLQSTVVKYFVFSNCMCVHSLW